MNLKRLFEIQRKLDEHIESKHPREEGEDRLGKKILALQVELGELANEWRGFKFWSNDQEPRTERERGICVHCCGTGNAFFDDDDEDWEDCHHCKGEGEEIFNPLLEEYVDCLHFILSIGLEKGFQFEKYETEWGKRAESINRHFSVLIGKASDFYDFRSIGNYNLMFDLFMGLGEMLGFTWEQIEQAYLEKNKVNHERQNQGY